MLCKECGKKKLVIIAIAAVLILVVGGIVAYTTFLSPEAQYDKYVEIAQKYLLEENYEEAIVAFNKAIEIDEKSIDARLGLADAYMGLGDSEKAIKQVEKALEIDSKKQVVWEKQADIYWQIEDIDALNNLLVEAEAQKIVLEGCEKAVIPVAPTIELVKCENEQTLKFSADADSQIYYTLDNSNPKTKGTKYVEPIEALNGKFTIKAVAKTSQGVYSSVVTEEKEIENKMPLGRMNTRPFEYVGMTFSEIVKEIGPIESEGAWFTGSYFFESNDGNFYIATLDSDIYNPNLVCIGLEFKMSVVFPEAKGVFTKEQMDLAFGEISKKYVPDPGDERIVNRLEYSDFEVSCDDNWKVVLDEDWACYYPTINY